MANLVLLTGPFGNVGESTLEKLLEKGYSVRCFDVKNDRNQKIEAELKKKGEFETIWGDVTNLENVSNAVKDVDCIIHLAAIIPPLSEKIPEIARKVNIEGTNNLIKAAKTLHKPPKFIVASSISVFGSRMADPPPRRVDEPVYPTDHYSHHKVEVEKAIMESGLPWLILRLGAVTSLNLSMKLDPIFFEIPLDQRIELLFTKDAGLAFANAVSVNIINKILLIGGGEGNRLYQRDYIKGILNALGMTMLPDSAFRVPKDKSDWYYTDWIDTEESQKLLQYQMTTFAQFLESFRKILAMRRFGIRMISPLVKLNLLINSPYYKFTKKVIKQLSKSEMKLINEIVCENKEKINLLEKQFSELEKMVKDIQSK